MRYYIKVASVHGVGILDKSFWSRANAEEYARTDKALIDEFGTAVWVLTAKETRQFWRENQ